jgi:membrane protein YqaA with SNARE-associated domain
LVDLACANAVRVAEHRWVMGIVFLLEMFGCTIVPIPNALIMVGLVTAAPRKWLKFALSATFGSMAGGFALYLIGRLFFQSVGQPLIAYYGADAHWATIGEWFNSGWGIGFVMFASITTGLFRIASLGAGFTMMDPTVFIVALAVGRCFRWTAECAAIKYVGERIHTWPKHYFKYAAAGAALVVIAAIVIVSFV